MQTAEIQQLISGIQETLSNLSKVNDPQTHQALTILGTEQCSKLELLIQAMPPNYLKQKLTNQLKSTKSRFQKYSQPRRPPSSSNQIELATLKPSREQSQKYALTRLIEIQVEQNATKISQEQLDKLTRQMQQIPAIMNDIASLVDKSGQDLDQIDDHLKRTLSDVKDANIKLDEADRLQVKALMTKIRLGVGTILGAIGAKLFGVVGGIAGFVTGMAGFR